MATKRTITLQEINPDITYSVKDDSVRGCHTEYGCNLKTGDKVVIDDYFCEIIDSPAAPTEEKKPATVSISKGNSKMGAIPSVSLPACITCNPSAPCFKLCYAAKITRLYKTVRNSYENNLNILKSDPALYWDQVKQAAQTTRFFRYHVSGDIPDISYFYEMIRLANELPQTRFLAFTKQYTIVNTALDTGVVIPSNLKIIFSNWGPWKCENPHRLPECEVILKGSEPAPDWKICGGNCTDCACGRGIGCWDLKDGETIAIYQH